MADVLLLWANATGYGDLSIDGADLAVDDGLQAAVLISLFSDARVTAEELPDGQTDRRGWWGDDLNEDDDQLGSKLWVLARRKQQPSVLADAEAFAREALEWMIVDGVASAIATSAAWAGQGELTLNVGVTLPDTSQREFQFDNVLRAA